MKQRYQEIQDRIAQACEYAQRDPAEITMVAVSKKQSVDDIKRAYDLGIRDFGENYLQEMEPKIQALPDDIRWHFVGSLQSKKIKYVSNQVKMVHSIDRASQVRSWKKELEHNQPVPDLLIQLNIAGEETKSGIDLENLEAFCQTLDGLPIKGLMSFPPYAEDPSKTVKYFEQTAKALEKLPSEFGKHLSMGVSSDFDVAITCGATHIRLGTILFGHRDSW